MRKETWTITKEDCEAHGYRDPWDCPIAHKLKAALPSVLHIGCGTNWWDGRKADGERVSGEFSPEFMLSDHERVAKGKGKVAFTITIELPDEEAT